MIEVNNGKLKRTKKPTGYILFEGKSLADGAPIVIIAITKSRNLKTGNMIQTYIIRSDMSPMQAIHSGNDVSICFGCKHRGDGTGKGRSCYVKAWQGVTQVYKAFKRGLYPKVSPIHPAFQAVTAGRNVRIGSYGDPATMPLGFWQAIIKNAKGWTGYTHQWKARPDLASIVMASCDTESEYEEAKAKGWRTFRIRLEGMPILERETSCPASAEAGKKASCDTCRLCRGNAIDAKSVVIIIHGGMAVESNGKRNLTKANAKRKLAKSTR